MCGWTAGSPHSAPTRDSIFLKPAGLIGVRRSVIKRKRVPGSC